MCLSSALVKLFLGICCCVWADREQDASEPTQSGSYTTVVLQQDADAHVLPADSFMSLEPPTAALDGLPSRLRTVEMRAGISGGLELRHLRAGAQQAAVEDSTELSYESLSLHAAMMPDGDAPLLAGNYSATSVDADSLKQDGKPRQPALYAVIAAMAASIGYMGLVAVRCSGLLHELAPKGPLADFIAAPQQLSRGSGVGGSEDGGFSRTRRARPAARLCLPAREPLRLTPLAQAVV